MTGVVMGHVLLLAFTSFPLAQAACRRRFSAETLRQAETVGLVCRSGRTVSSENHCPARARSGTGLRGSGPGIAEGTMASAEPSGVSAFAAELRAQRTARGWTQVELG